MASSGVRSIVPAAFLAGLVACGAGTTHLTTGAAPGATAAVAPELGVTRASPCGDARSLVVEPAAPIVARVSGATLTGGEGTIRIRWCGEASVVVDEVRLVGPGDATLVRALDSASAHLAHGEALDVTVTGTATPATLVVEATARDAAGAPVLARGSVECVEAPALVATRDTCVAAGGTFAPAGLAGAFACDRPTSDAGRPCLSAADCEGPCLEDRVEVVTSAPDGRACPAGEELRLHRGVCADHTLLFGCAPRLLDVTTECARPAMASRRSTVCVD